MNWFKKQLVRFANWFNDDLVSHDPAYVGEDFWDQLKVEKVQPKKGDTIIIKLESSLSIPDYDRSSFLQRTVKIIQDEFPDNHVIGMYDNISLKYLSDEDLLNMGLKRIGS